jgi:hypothetical protein
MGGKPWAHPHLNPPPQGGEEIEVKVSLYRDDFDIDGSEG